MIDLQKLKLIAESTFKNVQISNENEVKNSNHN